MDKLLNIFYPSFYLRMHFCLYALRRALVIMVLGFGVIGLSSVGNAAEPESVNLSASVGQLRELLAWKSSDEVRAHLGEPLSQRDPVGTHATYMLWEYDGVVVAFANGRVIHVFDKQSLARGTD